MLIAGVMGQNADRFLSMCFESLKNADKIIYIDGGSNDNSIKIAKYYGAEIIENKYNNGYTINVSARNLSPNK